MRRGAGFTLIEVMVAMALTALVGAMAYAALASVLGGVDGLRDSANRSYEVNRAWMILSRDIAQFANRPVRDEYGETEPALTGGELARFPLSLTRGGWHNPLEYPRSSLERVNYRIEDDALWRDSYVVLDRASDTEPRSVLLLEDVEFIELSFLGSVDSGLELRDGQEIETDNWPESWVAAPGSGGDLAPPVAMTITLRLTDLGDMERLYVLPPL